MRKAGITIWLGSSARRIAARKAARPPARVRVRSTMAASRASERRTLRSWPARGSGPVIR
jgi:hypothetical protein